MTTATRENQIISSEERLEQVLSKFDSHTDADFRQKVCVSVIRSGGRVVIGRYDLTNKSWDGSLELQFAEPPTAREVANIIKAANCPNDFGMEDDKTLWFWWD